MREELRGSLHVGNYKVGQIVQLVEDEVDRWECSQYTRITRALDLSGHVVHLETIFSKPAKEQPVPIAVVCVFFWFDAEEGRLTYQFEQDSVLHTVGGQSLAPGRFEAWLDRIIGDKLQVRQLHGLATPFEETRLAPPAMLSEASVAGSDALGEEMVQKEPTDAAPAAERAADGDGSDGLPLSTLLVNIFDAADEEDEYELTHKEVADLLYATPLGLADWDIKLLLTSALELDTGRIEYRPFVEQAPEIIQALLRRRAEYEAKRDQPAQVTLEAAELCYGEEVEEVARAAREAFAAVDPAGKGTLSRSEFRRCLLSRSERFSMMEVQMLMQMCKEDDFGQVPYDEFGDLLKQLRVDALHNALVETTVANLRVHLILLGRREGLLDSVALIWELRQLLLNADQLCLSRMQIHVILMITHPDEHGYVDFEYFLRICCTVIPSMFDDVAIKEKAESISKEKADALAKQEMEELQGFSSSLAAKRKVDEEDQEEVQANAPDRETVEKTLIHICNQADQNHRQQPTLEVRRFLDAMRHEAVQTCQLSEAEVRGFIAEAEVDPASQDIAYVEHIKTWVPILFELRKSHVYESILWKDWGFEAPQLVDLTEYEAAFPLRQHEPGDAFSRASSNDSMRSRKSSKRSLQRPGSAARGRATPTRGARRSGSKASVGGQEDMPFTAARMSRVSATSGGSGNRPGSNRQPNRRQPLARSGSRRSRSGSPASSENSSRRSYGRPQSRSASRAASRME